MLEDKLNQDLKTALLQGDKRLATILRGLKSAILYAKIAQQLRDQAVPDDVIIPVLQKEAKKRQESADLYQKGGSDEKAKAELFEKSVIEKYLPAQMDEAEVLQIIEGVILGLGEPAQLNLGQIIGLVKQQTGAAGDGALIARLVKERLSR